MKIISLALLAFPLPLFAAKLTPLKIPAEISAELRRQADPRESYAKLAPLLEKEGLELRFVVGKADERFLGIAPELWDPALDYETFSLTDALGRMLCKGHPRNKEDKPLILVRADEPGDTLLHEYLHFLQARRSPAVCALYQRLEASPGSDDLTENLLLEYEVVRILSDFGFASREIQVALLDKLLQYEGKIAPEARKKIDALYDWKPLQEKELKGALQEAIRQTLSNQKTLPDYQAQLTAAESASEKNREARAQESFSLLFPEAEAKLSLPLCVSAPSVPKEESGILQAAIQKWNRAGLASLQKEVFSTGCSNPRIELRWDTKAGKVGDGVLKLAEVKFLGEKSLVLVREKEWKQYQWMLAAMIRKSLAGKAEEERNAVKPRLAAFEATKRRQTLENLFAHELGHTLGLGHNFAVPSVMNYSDETTPTAYDEKALVCRFRNSCGGDFPVELHSGKQDPAGRD